LTAVRHARILLKMPFTIVACFTGIFLIVVCFTTIPFYARYSGGTGEPNDPYLITTAKDLMKLGKLPRHYNKHFILTTDIDLDPNLPGRKIFNGAVIAGRGITFTGIFDGNDHVISNLTVKGERFLGLFGELGYGARISNLGLEDVSVLGSLFRGGSVGGLVGRNGGAVMDCYPIVFLDCIVVKSREEGKVCNRSVYLALGINMDGQKELLGIWIARNEGAKFWLGVITELANRGVKDIFIACVDGLKGFPEAIESVFPKTQIQLCIVHMIRNSVKYVNWKDRKLVCRDLKTIYTSATEQQAEVALDAFGKKWDTKYPTISQMWRNHWEHVISLCPCIELNVNTGTTYVRTNNQMPEY